MSYTGSFDPMDMGGWGDPSTVNPQQPLSDPAAPPAAQPQPAPAQPTTVSPDDVMRNLIESLDAIRNDRDALRKFQDRHGAALNQHGAALAALLDRIRSVETYAQTTAASQPAPAYAPSSRAVKLRDPRKFSGKASEVNSFLRDLDAHFRLQHIDSSLDRADFMSMYLGDGSPSSWYNALVQTKSPDLKDWNHLRAAFVKHFQDPNIITNYLHKLEALRQTGSASDYANKFQEYMSYLHWPDEMQIEQFDRHLKYDLAKALLRTPRLKKIDEWIPIVVETDGAMYALEVEMRRESKSTNAKSGSSNQQRHDRAPPHPYVSHTTQSASAPSGSNDTVPMDVDAMRRGPLMKEEKDHRKRLDLCLYCGQAGHRIAQCPNGAKAKPSTKKAAPASSGKA